MLFNFNAAKIKSYHRFPSVYFLPAPNDKMKQVLLRTVEDAKALISKVSIGVDLTFLTGLFSIFLNVSPCFFQKQVQANVCLTAETVKEALDPLRGAVMIVYPMGLPPHDPIRMEFENQEDLSGTQVNHFFF